MFKFLSRKFLYPILYGALIVANRKYELGLSEFEIGSIGATVIGFITGETYLDSRKTK